MKESSIRNWLEIVGIVAVVASLIFVGMQLRQEQLIAHAELATGTADLKVRIYEMISEPDFAATYAKMLNAPDELSLAETVQLHGLHELVLQILMRECFIVTRGVFVECEDVFDELFPFYFGNQYSQQWWQANKSHSAYPLPAWVDKKISELDPSQTLRRLNGLHTSQ